ncbi:MAG: glycosyltransferase family 2 protein [Chloroflexota bacterium]|nr:glycosyltransferase family 2 protein [Chloroflexota bacterium]
MNTTNPSLDLSVVLPVYNEAGSLPNLIPELTTVLGQLGHSYEIIAIDDGSADNSVAVLRRLQEQEPHLRIVQFRRNFGQTAAFAAGFDYARGATIITLDADGQNDPADIPRLLKVMEGGDYDLVSGWRQNRREPFLTRKLPSMVANWLITNASDVRLHDRGCSLKALRRDLVKQMHLYGELHRFIPEIASQIGARVAEVPVNDRPRKAGMSKYGALSRTPRVILDLLTVSFLLSFSNRPMQLFGIVGLLSSGIGGLILIYLAGTKIVNGLLYGGEAYRAFRVGSNPWTMLAVLLVVVGVQFLMMGLLGEILTRTYHETQDKPIYVVRQVLDATQVHNAVGDTVPTDPGTEEEKT